MFQKTTMAAAITIATSVLLVACGDSNGNNNGAVVGGGTTPTTTLLGSEQKPALSAANFNASLGASASGKLILSVAGQPKCDVSISHIEYSTIGGAGEATTASGALMVPTGSDPSCTGKRPVVLYAHGTTTSKGFNMAALTTDPTNAAAGESTLVAATFAAQGYIVVAPNYAGYDTSTLAYHPYVNYKQQSQEMIDALKAGRAALPKDAAGTTTTDSGKLFVTGYSEGGYVAMAALKAMDAAHIPVTAGAPMSGPYSLEAYGDAIFYGNTPIGGTVFAPLLTTSYQKAYGNIYNITSDAYTSAYAANIDTLLPTTLSQNVLFTTGKLPQLALFQSVAGSSGGQVDPITGADLSTSQFSFGFDPSSYLINTSYRAAYLKDAAANPDGAVPALTASPLPATAPQHPLRKAFALNDLRGYVPSMPVLMCGGNQDPTVFFAPNAQLMAGILGNIAGAGAPVAFALLDVDTTSKAPVGFSSAGLNTSVTTNMKAVAQQAQTGFGTILGATKDAAIEAAKVDPKVVAAANAAGQAAYVKVLTAGGSQADAAAAAKAAGTAVVTAAATSAATAAVASSYHGSLVPPFCTSAARAFFQQY
ncbi:alpha/beta hydrolase family protein [Aquirhabdus parva]|uniref:Alpha/beta hydrolase n=1 Tax=Aquirhabdus parva TaxID=2283318 RepID=A0A345P5X3_9GAMM|nr:prolyl oligopeptidase family serine peptidase [Aquirhabdus parva]AXI02682.1 alpha/beta hydrolase [Aquirhabdus parva]